MAANSEDIKHISSACAIATQALEAIGNLQSSEIRNLAASTVTNSALNGSNLPTIISLMQQRFLLCPFTIENYTHT